MTCEAGRVGKTVVFWMSREDCFLDEESAAQMFLSDLLKSGAQTAKSRTRTPCPSGQNYLEQRAHIKFYNCV